MFLQCPFNSDSANFVLEGNDILDGNILLSGWNLTGISFIASDLLLYILAAIFYGISPETAVAAVAMAICFLTLFCLLIMYDEKEKESNIWGFLFFFAIAAVPNASLNGAGTLSYSLYCRSDAWGIFFE